MLDASAAIAWVVPDEFDDEARALLRFVQRSGALVPPLWLAEVENALRNAHRRKRLTLEDGLDVLDRLRRLPLRVVDAHESPVFYDALGISIECDISVYDAVYLDAARRHGATLVSRDRRLLKAAERMGIDVLSDARALE